jgi:exodeoxyribonuclease-3
MQKLVSWNVNGIRAVWNKGFPEWLESAQPDILCVQETKAWPDQVGEDILKPPGYHSYWECAEKKGYSGVATWVKQEPLSVRNMGIQDYDNEGRVQILEYPNYTLINAYFPNSQEKGKRIDYKIAFCEDMLKLCNSLRKQGKNIILCGDFNIAHTPIDLTHPKRNEANPGYLPEERAWMDKWIAQGYLDCFRLFNDQPQHYTWWSYRANARANNVGWRIDYHSVNEEFRDRVHDAVILPEVMGSDHCPIVLEVRD